MVFIEAMLLFAMTANASTDERVEHVHNLIKKATDESLNELKSYKEELDHTDSNTFKEIINTFRFSHMAVTIWAETKESKPELLRFLLESNADINANPNNKFIGTPLARALWNLEDSPDGLSKVMLLLKKKADFKLVEKSYSYSLLEKLIAQQKEGTEEYILDQFHKLVNEGELDPLKDYATKEELNLKDMINAISYKGCHKFSVGRNTLHIWAESENVTEEVLQFLLKNGGDIESETREEEQFDRLTPLALAVGRSKSNDAYFQNVKLLLENNANPNVHNEFRDGHLLFDSVASKEERNLKVAASLILHGAKLDEPFGTNNKYPFQGRGFGNVEFAELVDELFNLVQKKFDDTNKKTTRDSKIQGKQNKERELLINTFDINNSLNEKEKHEELQKIFDSCSLLKKCLHNALLPRAQKMRMMLLHKPKNCKYDLNLDDSMKFKL